MADPILLHDELTELQTLCAEATPGPWRFNEAGYVEGSCGEFVCQFAVTASEKAQCDARLVTVARDALPKLIAEVRRLRGVLGSPCCEKCATNANGFKCGICGVEVG